jgi:hypothetical protein
MPRCFVMQPFDGADFDKRYDEIYKPAIEEAGFDPYRVDRDPHAAIPIENIESGIRNSVACFVDISLDNPNVWFELGYAICANKPLCLVCTYERSRFPFDIQHRKIIRYKNSSPSDFDALKAGIVERLKAIQATDTTIEHIIKEPQTAQQGDLNAMGFSALCIIFEEQDAEDNYISSWSIANAMERLGYNKLATRIALKTLVQRGLISVTSQPHERDEGSYSAYNMKDAGADYIMSHTDNLELRKQSRAAELSSKLVSFGRAAPKAASGDIDDDIPF